MKQRQASSKLKKTSGPALPSSMSQHTLNQNSSPSSSSGSSILPSPSFLLKIHDEKKIFIDEACAKLKSVHMRIATYEKQFSLNLTEFLCCFPILDKNLTIVQTHAAQSSPKHVLDTYHLGRFYRYLCDLDETVQVRSFHEENGKTKNAKQSSYFFSVMFSPVKMKSSNSQ